MAAFRSCLYKSQHQLHICQLTCRPRILKTRNEFSSNRCECRCIVNRAVSSDTLSQIVRFEGSGRRYSTRSRFQTIPNPFGQPKGTFRQRTRDRRQMWLLIIPVTTFCLGTWQIFRLKWKLGLVDQLERKTRQQPVLITNESVM